MRITINPTTGQLSAPCDHSSCNRILPDGSRRCSRCGQVYRLGFILPDRMPPPPVAPVPVATPEPAPYRLASGEATHINPYALTAAPTAAPTRSNARKGPEVCKATRIAPAAPVAPGVALQILRAILFPVILLLRFYGWVARVGLKALGD